MREAGRRFRFASKALQRTGEFLSTVGIILTLVSLSSAQVDRAGLNGTVTDPSGRVVPQTRVVAVKPATVLQRETVTSP